MSTDSLALLRKNAGRDIAALAEEHFKHDLQDSDRDALVSAASKISTHVSVGSLLGLGLGAFLAFRIRRTRMQMFNAFRAHEKPTHVKFANGREEAIPDATALMRPTTLGDVAAYTFFGFGGLFIGGEIGILTGSASAGRTISRDSGSRERIETAFRRFRADLLRKEADTLDKKKGVTELLGL
ncbi:MAG: hypothetical protein L6R40_004839 [Gallowayella cf. fulva]|nr:MAG: hypothetical protein L6R40_004839 [Xanthomendoza cf. fulva]